MSDTFTYTRDGVPVPADPGRCSRCGKIRPIVSVSRWGRFCQGCYGVIERSWAKRFCKDWNEDAPTDLPPFELKG